MKLLMFPLILTFSVSLLASSQASSLSNAEKRDLVETLRTQVTSTRSQVEAAQYKILNGQVIYNVGNIGSTISGWTAVFSGASFLDHSNNYDKALLKVETDQRLGNISSEEATTKRKSLKLKKRSKRNTLGLFLGSLGLWGLLEVVENYADNKLVLDKRQKQRLESDLRKLEEKLLQYEEAFGLVVDTEDDLSQSAAQ